MAKKKDENKQVLEEQMDAVAKLCDKFERETLTAIMREGMESLSEDGVPLPPEAVATTAVAGAINACAMVMTAAKMVKDKKVDEDKLRRFLTDICNAAIEDLMMHKKWEIFNTNK